MSNQSAKFQIDEFDQKLIKLLSRNGKLTNRALARHLSVTDVTIANRLKRLFERKIAHVVRLRDIHSTSYTLNALLIINVANKHSGKVVADKFAEIEEVKGSFASADDSKVTISLVANNGAHLRQMLEKQVSKIKGVDSIDYRYILDVVDYKPEWAPKLGN